MSNSKKNKKINTRYKETAFNVSEFEAVIYNNKTKYCCMIFRPINQQFDLQITINLNQAHKHIVMQ